MTSSLGPSRVPGASARAHRGHRHRAACLSSLLRCASRGAALAPRAHLPRRTPCACPRPWACLHHHRTGCRCASSCPAAAGAGQPPRPAPSLEVECTAARRCTRLPATSSATRRTWPWWCEGSRTHALAFPMGEPLHEGPGNEGAAAAAAGGEQCCKSCNLLPPSRRRSHQQRRELQQTKIAMLQFEEAEPAPASRAGQLQLSDAERREFDNLT